MRPRGATSRSDIDDLFNIHSFGFRGEALYSIAAVSDITVRSKPPQADTGWEIHQRGSQTLGKRPVQSRALSFQLNQAYRGMLPPEANPFFILFLTVPAKNVDVNIHPTKREVKIKDEYALGSLVHDLCSQALTAKGKAKQAHITKTAESTAFQEIRTLPDSHGIEPSANQYTFSPSPAASSPVKEESAPYEAASPMKNTLAHAQYIGCFARKYLLFESTSSLLIIDQHAAHERITFEALKNQLGNGRIEIQQLLAPVLIKLSPEELLNWEEGKDKIGMLGLSTTLWDKQTIAIHAHPMLIRNPEFAVRNLLTGESIARCDKETLARRACRQSVMAGHQLNREEAENPRKQLLRCKDPFTCPHGRPTVVEIQEKQLSKYFLR